MSSPPNRIRWLLTVAGVLGVLVAAAAVIYADRARGLAEVRQLRREAAQLREQLEARDTTIATLQADVQELRRGAPVADRPQAASASPAELELARRVAALALQQSNTAVVLERLLTRTGDALPPAEVAQRRAAALTALEAAAQEGQEQLEAAKQKAAELLVSLGVPAEVSTVEAAKALDTASLRAYWPFFEAKRERDALQFVAERLRMRIVQERVDERIEGAK